MSNSASSSATLENTPLLHLLISVADRQMSGTLLFTTPGEMGGAVVFERGTPRKTSAPTPKCRLSDLLVEFGWLDQQSAEQSYALALARREPHGRVLLEQRLLDELDLVHVLRHQLLRKLGWLSIQAPATQLALHENVDMLAQIPFSPPESSPLRIVWAIARHYLDDRHKRIVLDRISERALRLHRRFDPELFGFNSAELELVERLRHGSLDVTSLLYQLELPRATAEAMLYVLVLTRHIDFGDTRAPIGVTLDSRNPSSHASGEFFAAHASVTHTSLPPNLESLDIVGQLRRDLLALASRLDSVDYYTLLGVARDAPLTAIRAAVTALARRYHPDHLPTELLDQRSLATKVQARLTVAYRTLADAELRARYDSDTPPPPSTVARERVARRSLADEALRRAEQLLKRDRSDLAEVEASRALELDPSNARCIALHAWIRALRPNGQAVLDQVLESLTQALDLDPMNVQTRFYRSQILKRLERLDEAVGEWQLITEMSPNHIDALRELRLWEMRRRSSGPPKSSQSGTHPQVRTSQHPAGLLGRLFKGSH